MSCGPNYQRDLPSSHLVRLADCLFVTGRAIVPLFRFIRYSPEAIIRRNSCRWCVLVDKYLRDVRLYEVVCTESVGSIVFTLW